MNVEKVTVSNYTKNMWGDCGAGNFWSNYQGNDTDKDGIGCEPFLILGEYYTGGQHQKGEWIEFVYGVDYYPLMQPFNISSSELPKWAQPPQEQQPLPISADSYPLFLATAAAGTGIVLVTAVLAVYLRKYRGKS